MFYAYVTRFDVTGNFEKIWELNNATVCIPLKSEDEKGGGNCIYIV